MTHPIYTQTNLEALTTAEIKTIAHSIGAIPDGDRRKKQTWISAIIDHQIKFSPAKEASRAQWFITLKAQMEAARVDYDEYYIAPPLDKPKTEVVEMVDEMDTDYEPTTKESESVPQDLIEDEALKGLELEVVDNEVLVDWVIPHGELRWFVYRSGVCIGAVKTWERDGELSYHTPISPYRGYSSLFEALTSFLPRGEVALAYSDAECELRERFATFPDYI